MVFLYIRARVFNGVLFAQTLYFEHVDLILEVVIEMLPYGIQSLIQCHLASFNDILHPLHEINKESKLNF